MKKITTDTLLDLGFIKDPERHTRWYYKGIGGSFISDLTGRNCFYFFDCSMCIEYIDDLYFMVRLINYNYERIKTDKERDCEIQ
jgi:hypothetical protein